MVPWPPAEECSYQLPAAARALLGAFEAGLGEACTNPPDDWSAPRARLSALLDATADVAPEALLAYDLTSDAGFDAAVADLAGERRAALRSDLGPVLR